MTTTRILTPAELRDLTVHPGAELFPAIEGDEYAAFRDDIQAYGRIREPLVIWRGQLADGRNRRAVALELNYDVEAMDLADDADPYAFIVSANIRRRHQNASDLAILAAKLVTMSAGDNQHSGGVSTKDAAKTTGASVASTKRAVAVLNSGDSEVIEKLENRELTVGGAEQELRDKAMLVDEVEWVFRDDMNDRQREAVRKQADSKLLHTAAENIRDAAARAGKTHVVEKTLPELAAALDVMLCRLTETGDALATRKPRAQKPQKDEVTQEFDRIAKAWTSVRLAWQQISDQAKRKFFEDTLRDDLKTLLSPTYLDLRNIPQPGNAPVKKSRGKKGEKAAAAASSTVAA